MEDDVVSVFSYDEEEGCIPDQFSLTALRAEADRIFYPRKCSLQKFEEGGYHKVYDIKTSDGEDMGVVARVACPAFPKDKMDSEVATLKYLAKKTSVPVPAVIFWNSDADNAVGAEYMFISKVPGVPATSIWSEMSIDKKKNLVRQVAENLMKLWSLRFDAIGSLYLNENRNDFVVGPIVENHFLTKCDGFPRIKEPIDLSEFRGPFTSISSYLQSGLRSELRLCAERRDDLIVEADGSPERVESGRKGMEKALELCEIYPGDKPLTNDTKEPITLKLGDFRLANIMVNSFFDLPYLV
ncbi:hypothetical protein SCHPADRAFT_840467 [Schizopora paradoxa]|uniref:Aminoglycoside phosphotransferase domain-containing protein n=1 Tax=Schizopora paradoxa TaxID=27342 RepID=A0A0H2QYU3_9AGAM|nr:hypothetical protein SCHPADRAFT_840467 [Schizopora paradoxa]